MVVQSVDDVTCKGQNQDEDGYYGNMNRVDKDGPYHLLPAKLWIRRKYTYMIACVIHVVVV